MNHFPQNSPNYSPAMNNTPGLIGPVGNAYSARMSGAMSGNNSPAYSPAIGIMPTG